MSMNRLLALITVAIPSLSSAAWEVNMPRGVTPTSEVAYDIHMLMSVSYTHLRAHET